MGLRTVKLRTKNHDVQGMSVARLLRRYLGGRVRPLWSFGGGLELRHILSLSTRHYLGYPIAYLTTRYNRQWQLVLRNWRRVQSAMRKDQVRGAEHVRPGAQGNEMNAPAPNRNTD